MTKPEAKGSFSPLRVLLTCLSGWCLPGGGHLFLKRRGRGLVFLALILAMFILGLLMDGKLYYIEPGQPLSYLATLGNLGIGSLYLILKGAGYGQGNAYSLTYEYGNTFILVASLLNVLVILDAYDIAVRKKG